MDVAQILRECLESGSDVDIEGFGTLHSIGPNQLSYCKNGGPRVFLAYASEDAAMVERIYGGLKARGFSPWLDRRKLMPGQNWPRAIEGAIRVADYFLPCFSKLSSTKHGRFHAELRYALDCAALRPLDGVFIVPLRIEECSVPARLSENIQYVDLFPDFDTGLNRVCDSLQPVRILTSS